MSGLDVAGRRLSTGGMVRNTLGRKLSGSLASKKLSAMLRNTLQSFPTAKLQTRKGGFGVFTDDGTYLYVSFSSNLTRTEKRDFLALFSTWLVADPDALNPSNIRPGG
jgi:hypothetical protein